MVATIITQPCTDGSIRHNADDRGQGRLLDGTYRAWCRYCKLPLYARSAASYWEAQMYVIEEVPW